MKFLGHVVDGDGIRADPEKITAVRSMPEPSNITQLRGFLDMANQLAKFMARPSRNHNAIEICLERKPDGTGETNNSKPSIS